MIYRPEIAACDQCGVCCTMNPCLLKDAGDVDRLAAFLKIERLPFIGKYLQLEKLTNGWQVRLRRAKNGACVFLKNNRCSVQSAKPTGGADFKCWDLRTFNLSYVWTDEAVRGLTGVSP